MHRVCMAKGTLSMQLGINRGRGKLSSRFSTTSSRLSRTDRIKAIQQKEKLLREQKAEAERLERLKAEAEKIQAEQFKTKTRTETYTAYRNKNWSIKRWDDMDVQEKQYILAKSSPQDLEPYTATRTITTPFSYELQGENIYSNVYENLSPELKQFFQDPTTAKVSYDTAKQTQIDDNVRRMQEQVEGQNRNIASIKLQTQSDEQQRDLSYAQRYKEEYLKGISKLQQGFSYDSVVSYAEQTAQAYRDRVEGRVSNTSDYQKLITSGDPFVNVYKASAEKYGVANIDWSDQSNLGLIRQEKWIQTYGNLSANLISQGKLSDPTVQTFKGIVGEKKFGALQTEIQEQKLKQVELDPEQRASLQAFHIRAISNNIEVREGALPYQTRGTQLYHSGGIPYKNEDYKNLYFSGSKTKSEDGFFMDKFNKIMESKIVQSALQKGSQLKKDTSFVITKPNVELNNLIGFNIGTTGITGGLDISHKGKALGGGDIIYDYGADTKEAWKYVEEITQKDREKFDLKHNIYQVAGEEDFQNTLNEMASLEARKKYGKEIVAGTFNQEKFNEEFLETEGAKGLMKEYQEAIELARANTPKWDQFVYGAKQLGLKTIQFALSSTGDPVSLTGTTLGVTALVGTTTAIGMIPYGSIGLTSAFTIKGGMDAFNPLSSPEKAGAGFVTGLIGLGTLGYMGVRYLRSPTFHPKVMKLSKADLQASQTVGKDIKLIGKGGAEINKVIYNQQKLSQQAFAGRRVVVSTKGRDILKNFWKELGLTDKQANTGLSKNIYEGIPTQQKAIYGSDIFRGGRYKITASGYEQATKKLLKYGWTESQARQTLRYTSPKFIESYLDKGMITLRNNGAIGEFVFSTRQPKIKVRSGEITTTTRGARTIKELYRVDRQVLNLKDVEKQIIFEKKFGISAYVNNQKSLTFKDLTYSQGYLRGGASELKEGFEHISTDKLTGTKIFKPAQYKDLLGIGVEKGLKLSLKNDILRIDTQNRIDITRSTLINKEIDLNKLLKTNFVASKTLKRTPLSDTFGYKDDVAKKILSTETKGFASGGGAGSTSGLSKTSQTQINNLLKSHISASTTGKITKIKDIIRLDTKTSSAILSGSSSVQALLNIGSLKSATSPKLKIDTLGKTDLKLNSILKLGVPTSSKSLNKLLQQQIKLISPTTTIPRSSYFKNPVILKQPKIPVIVWPYLEGKPTRKKKSKKTKQIQDLLYLPDFTSRTIGLGATTLSEKQAQSQLKRILTGLEIRRPVKIKY